MFRAKVHRWRHAQSQILRKPPLPKYSHAEAKVLRIVLGKPLLPRLRVYVSVVAQFQPLVVDTEEEAVVEAALVDERLVLDTPLLSGGCPPPSHNEYDEEESYELQHVWSIIKSPTYINKKSISIYGSQGQKRTAIISLKLAEANVLEEEIEEKPIILLDDFMSELDNKRIQGLFENIKENQVIITCTNKLKVDNLKCKLFKISNAKAESV